jgi:succinate dehydrogenase / fumarate reductase cytochrome b subunit
MHLVAFWRRTVGKKAVMAVTGLIWLLYLVVHLAGNLLVFAGPSEINGYSKFLHEHIVVLWISRVILIVALVLHIVAAYQLARRSRAARRVPYRSFKPQSATLASRTMRLGGVAIAVFIAFHLLHLTTGTIEPTPFSPHDVYANLVGGFRIGWLVALYLVALVAVGAHLYHGAWGWFRTLGWTRSPDPHDRPLAAIVTAALWLGFTIIPLAVYFRIIG